MILSSKSIDFFENSIEFRIAKIGDRTICFRITITIIIRFFKDLFHKQENLCYHKEENAGTRQQVREPGMGKRQKECKEM